MTHTRTTLIFVAAVLAASPAFAQSDLTSRTAVSFTGGFGSTTNTTGIALGGSLLFDVNDRTSIEGQGTYLDRGTGADALSATASLLVNLRSGRKQIVPYAAVGGGVYRTWVDLANPRLMGATPPGFAPGSMICAAPGSGSGFGRGPGFGPGTTPCPTTVAGYWGVGHMSEFYAQRLGAMMVPPGGAWESRTFTDVAMSLGGGLRFNVSDRVMVRPDLRALTAIADGEMHTMTVFVVHLAYRF